MEFSVFQLLYERNKRTVIHVVFSAVHKAGPLKYKVYWNVFYSATTSTSAIVSSPLEICTFSFPFFEISVLEVACNNLSFMKLQNAEVKISGVYMKVVI